MPGESYPICSRLPGNKALYTSLAPITDSPNQADGSACLAQYAPLMCQPPEVVSTQGAATCSPTRADGWRAVMVCALRAVFGARVRVSRLAR